MNFFKLNDQLCFLDKKLIIWTKFYLLSDNNFQLKFENAYEQLLNEFEKTFTQRSGHQLDLDKFINNETHSGFLLVFDNIIKTKALSKEEIIRDSFNSGVLKQFERKELGRLVSDNLPVNNLKDTFSFLRNSISNFSFYDVSYINPDQIAGEWVSVKETGQLRINYNMTDYMPCGNQLRLNIQKYNNEFYTFECFAKAHDYQLDKYVYIMVFEALIKIEKGYIHYYRRNDLVFIFKRPVYNYKNNTFTTQTYNLEFVFERPNHALKSTISAIPYT